MGIVACWNQSPIVIELKQRSGIIKQPNIAEEDYDVHRNQGICDIRGAFGRVVITDRKHVATLAQQLPVVKT
jgi:hypothetical protein